MHPARHAHPNVRDAMVARGWSPASWQAAGHAIDPYADSFAGGYWSANPYVSAEPPRVVVSAAAPRPAGPREPSHATPAVLPGTLAHDLLSRWLAPLAANRAPARTPLLVIGRSAWDAVAETIAASAGRSYPFNFPRMSLHELPTDATTAMLLRSNAHDARVIHVGLPSVEAAAALAPSLGRLRTALPQHSWVFFAPAASPDGPPCIPAAVRDHFTTVTWADLDPRGPLPVPEPRSSGASGSRDALLAIEASFLRVGGQPQLGLMPAQRMGLEHVPYRDAALAALHEETRTKARYWTALEGDVRDTKRVRLNDFNRGAGIVTSKDHGDFGAHTRA